MEIRRRSEVTQACGGCSGRRNGSRDHLDAGGIKVFDRHIGTFRPRAAVLALAFAVLGVSGPVARAETIGTKLNTDAQNVSVCNFEPKTPFPETRYCGIMQSNVDLDHQADDGLVAPFNGRVVRWSVVYGPRSANTGEITLALRTRSPSGLVSKGSAFVLPPTDTPSTRADFPDDLPIAEGGEIALRIAITTLGTEEKVGVPLATAGLQYDNTWTSLRDEGEPWPPGGGFGFSTDHQALMLEAEVVSTEDTAGPVVHRRLASRQDLRHGAVIRVRSDENGSARAVARIKIQGRKGSFPVRSRRRRLRSGRWTVLALEVSERTRHVIAAAEEDSREITLRGTIRAFDAAANLRAVRFRIKHRSSR
jgi:hypothetical protein